MNVRRALLGFVALSLILVAGTPGLCEKKSAARQYIFSRSTVEGASSFLGVKGVPAYVVLGGQNRRGIYITAGGGALATKMGLRPGMVLLTLNNRVVDSAENADNILAAVSPGTLDYAVVRMSGGQPQYLPASCAFDGTRSSNMLSSGSSSGGNSAKSLPQSSISELEKYAIQLINQERGRERAQTVSESSSLSNLARDYAEYMLKNESFSHVDPDGRDPQTRAKQAGVRAGVYENLGFHSRGQISDKDCVKACHDQMMSEPKNQHNHRYNILHPDHQFVGVGVARNNGKIMIVHEFTDSSP